MTDDPLKQILDAFGMTPYTFNQAKKKIQSLEAKLANAEAEIERLKDLLDPNNRGFVKGQRHTHELDD